MIDLLERNNNTTTQSQLEKTAYESLVHTWETDDDYYVYKEQRQKHHAAGATKTGLLSALLSGLIVAGHVDDE